MVNNIKTDKAMKGLVPHFYYQTLTNIKTFYIFYVANELWWWSLFIKTSELNYNNISFGFYGIPEHTEITENNFTLNTDN
jgi:hypothetical protein